MPHGAPLRSAAQAFDSGRGERTVKRSLRLISLAFAGIAGLALTAGAVLSVVANRRINRQYAVAVVVPTLHSDSAVIQRGRHLAVAVAGCVDCHGYDFGGAVLGDTPLLGRLVADNITPGRGGVVAGYTDADWVRTITHGVGPGGRSLLWMPSRRFRDMADADLAALIVFLKSLPPVDRELPPSQFGLLGRALLPTGILERTMGPLIAAEWVDHSRLPVPPPTRGVTVEYGRYLARIAYCHGCHGPDLAGGRGPPPRATNLTSAALRAWSDDDFIRAMRFGARPDGTPIGPGMPWVSRGQMTDDELRALWRYIRSAPHDSLR